MALQLPELLEINTTGSKHPQDTHTPSTLISTT